MTISVRKIPPKTKPTIARKAKTDQMFWVKVMASEEKMQIVNEGYRVIFRPYLKLRDNEWTIKVQRYCPVSLNILLNTDYQSFVTPHRSKNSSTVADNRSTIRIITWRDTGN